MNESTDIHFGLIFEIDGESLCVQLEDLASVLSEQAKEKETESKTVKAEPSQTITATTAAKRENFLESELLREARRLNQHAFDASIWAAEARRNPKQIWKLSMSQLRWLRQTLAPVHNKLDVGQISLIPLRYG